MSLTLTLVLGVVIAMLAGFALGVAWTVRRIPRIVAGMAPDARLRFARLVAQRASPED